MAEGQPMQHICEMLKCHNPVQIRLKARGLCSVHGNQVIDSARDNGLAVSCLTAAHVDGIINDLGDAAERLHASAVAGEAIPEWPSR